VTEYLYPEDIFASSALFLDKAIWATITCRWHSHTYCSETQAFCSKSIWRRCCLKREVQSAQQCWVWI